MFKKIIGIFLIATPFLQEVGAETVGFKHQDRERCPSGRSEGLLAERLRQDPDIGEKIVGKHLCNYYLVGMDLFSNPEKNTTVHRLEYVVSPEADSVIQIPEFPNYCTYKAYNSDEKLIGYIALGAYHTLLEENPLQK